MLAGSFSEADNTYALPLRAKLFGLFCLTRGDRSAGPWPRPTARRLIELIIVSPGRRLGRDAAAEILFPQLTAVAAARAVAKAAAMARTALGSLGDDVPAMFVADRGFLYFAGVDLESDFEAHQNALRLGLSMAPGQGRDDCLVTALAEDGVLLEEEPYADWSIGLREALEAVRQEARLTLARDRARGYGRSGGAEVAQAWEECFAHDPACEEAAAVLLRAYGADGRATLAAATYRRCRDALADLGLRVSPALEQARATIAASPARLAAGPVLRAGEDRRLVSVLFAEVSGPLGSNRLGPEELRDLVGGALAEIIAHIEGMGGAVTSVSGAGLVALFGAPEAHEDDPERALRAAFRCISGASQADGLSLRAGVETGPAVAGPIGEGPGAHYGAVGEVVGTAAALQSVARAASVLVGPATRSATEGLFEWGPTEEVVLSPTAKPLLASYLGRPKARPAGRAGRRGLAATAPLVGREPELTVLSDAIRGAVAGNGAVVELVGEPGLGKTRLVQECRKLFLAWVGAATGRLPLWLEGRAASYASSTPYGQYQHLLGAWVGISGEDDEQVAHAALERALKAAFGGKVDNDRLGLISQVMGISAAKSGAITSQLGPEPLRQASFSAVSQLVSRLVQHGPTVMVLEDLHWSDPTSLRLTEQLFSLTSQGPLLLLITRRPGPEPGVAVLEAALDHAAGIVVQKLELSPLAGSEERDLTRALLGPGVADDVVDAVTKGADGNPLFLEERLASLLETKALVKAERGGWRLDHLGPGGPPEALERLVRARVDRLGEGPRQAIVAASVLGGEFTLGELSSVTDLKGGLDDAVGELCSAGLLFETAKFPEPTYRFRHTLIQEATYKSLLKQQRQRLHARAASALEQASAGRLDEAATVLGHHFARAGDTERAVHHLELAADRAAQSFANDEAITSYRQALELLRSDPDVIRSRAARIWLKLGRLLQHLGRYGEARVAYQEAAPLVADGRAVDAAQPYIALGLLEVHDRRHDEALAAFAVAEALLPGSGDRVSDDWAATWIDIQLFRCSHHWSWNEPEGYAAVLGRLRPVVGALGHPRQKANFFAHVAAQRSKVERFTVDDNVIADFRAAWAVAVASGLEIELNYVRWCLGSALLCLGDIDGARAELEEGLRVTRRTGDRSLELRCLTFLAWAHLRQHDVATVRELAMESEELARAHSYPEIAPMAKALLAWVAWKEGRLAAAGDLAEAARCSWAPFRGRYPYGCTCLLPLAAVRLAKGRGAEAIRAARELLEPPQLRLPVELEKRVGLAISAWDGGQHALACHRLAKALELAEQMKYI